MTSESSPFRPGQPVPAELFVGRLDAIERLRGLVRSAGRGVFKIGFITGERGIGKSSLASFVRRLCERDSGVTGCHVYLGGAHDLHEMARHVFDRLLKDSIDRPWRRQVLEFFGDRVRKIGLFGVSAELALNAADLRTIAGNFVPSVRQLLRQMERRTSLLLILDDINGLAGSAEFAHWLKSIVDEAATSEPVNLCILLVGLEERHQDLIRNQPSLARIFNPVDIPPGRTPRSSTSTGSRLRPATLRCPRTACVQWCSIPAGCRCWLMKSVTPCGAPPRRRPSPRTK